MMTSISQEFVSACNIATLHYAKYPHLRLTHGVDLVLAGEGDCAQHHQPQQGPACRADRLPAPARGSAAQGGPVQGPAGEDADFGPQQAHFPQPGPHPSLHPGETMRSAHLVYSGFIRT